MMLTMMTLFLWNDHDHFHEEEEEDDNSTGPIFVSSPPLQQLSLRYRAGPSVVADNSI
jgi:hypothetical protein